MSQFGAIIFLTREGEEATLLAPLGMSTYLAHLAASLERAGVSRFLVACREADAQTAAAAFSAETVFATADALGGNKKLDAFLEQCGQVAAITAPVFLSDAACAMLMAEAALPQKNRPLRETGVFRAEAAALREALAAGADVFACLTQAGERLYWQTEQDTRPVCAKDALRYPHPHEGYARANLLARHAANGVRVLCPEDSFISPEAVIGRGTTLLPGTIIRGRCVIGADCELGPNTMLTGCEVGAGTVMNATQAVDSKLGSNCIIGPFAYIRPGCVLADRVKVGDFAELKNSTVGAGTKIPHLTYVGDSDVGAGCNFGCGTITVNYDGVTKERCVVEDNAFVGCNTNLVAPVRVGAGAYIAAGSTITSDVPADSLAIARARQEVKRDWAKKKR